MKIGIIGSGNVGGTLGRLWAAAGEDVMFSSRHPEHLRKLASIAGPRARVGTPDEAARFGDVILEAVPFGAVSELPAEKLAGKVVISASNYYPERDGQMELGGLTQTEYAAKQWPGAHVVKAFNMMRANMMKELLRGAGRPGLAIFMAGDEPEAKRRAAQLITEAKFVPVDAGSLREGRAFERGGPLYDTQMPADQAREVLTAETSNLSTRI